MRLGSWRASPDCVQDHLGVCLGGDAVPGTGDPTFGVDQVGDALGDARGANAVVGLADQLVDVAQQLVGKVELLGEGRVLVLVVKADPEDGGVLGLECLGAVAEPATLDRSTWGVGDGIEPQHDPSPAELAQRDGAAVVGDN